ncbi:MAG: SDR family NAD(P)-dependent oxidoreductase [Candidatus Lokiarchaeota archaeon]|nr:SDR family NAD(P)-dependent oxidoreductase [Candidatus Lokiarchaeota archaeon]MBD3198470.1 SDR family NAD(P)-dependent oxidoreductase [Candidatus Lokiarchaeota archaeon]
MRSLKDKTLFITGSSRGIGKAIALKAAKDGANIAVVAKTSKPHPKLPGTVYTSVEEIEKAGGKGLACITDIRFEDQVKKSIEDTVEEFGGIDILINNASAISLTSTLHTEMKRFDLMWSVNARGTFLCSKLCIPYLKKSDNPHILTMSPPLDLNPKWFVNSLAYTMSKYGMSMCILGLAEEFKDHKIAANALWPKTAIATSAVKNLLGGESAIERSRKPEIVADAAYYIITEPSKECTGNFFIDEGVLKKNGVTNFARYAVNPDTELIKDFFLDVD